MNIAIDAPKRPALRYYGGKWNLAPWIISHFPKHLNYVEPCGGAASVLLQKPRSALETYNDLDGNVVNFFRVLRDQPDELIRKIKLTPWSRAEYELSLQPCENSTERARRFFWSCWQCMNGGTYSEKTVNDWRSNKYGEQCLSDRGHKHEKNLHQIAARFEDVQIENRPALNIVERYDNEDSLFYFDPPYVTNTRAQGERYALEWTDANHIEAAILLHQCAGYVVISGYACPLYADLYESQGWQRIDREAQTNSGGKRIESLWLSPRAQEALGKPQQSDLFAEAQA